MVDGAPLAFGPLKKPPFANRDAKPETKHGVRGRIPVPSGRIGCYAVRFLREKEFDKSACSTATA